MVTYLEMSSCKVNLSIRRVWQLWALFLWSDTGHPTHTVTQAQLPLVLAPVVGQALRHALDPLHLRCCLVPHGAVLLSRSTPAHLLSEHPVAIPVP